MSMSLSVLQNATAQDVRSEPFPYLVVRNALPEELSDQLVASYPDPAVMGVSLQKSNVRWSYGASDVLANDAISPLWKDFVGYHVSEAFYREVVDLFGSHISALYPTLFPTEEALRTKTLGLRSVHEPGERDVLLDAQICGNTPVAEASSVRTAHVDHPTKLFAGLYYLRRDEDDSSGGDLRVMRFRDSYASPGSRLDKYKGVYVKEEHLEAVETVTYEKNTLILFLNSRHSLHGVTVRQPTSHTRIFLNLVGKVGDKLFRIPSRRRLIAMKARERLDSIFGARAG